MRCVSGNSGASEDKESMGIMRLYSPTPGGRTKGRVPCRHHHREDNARSSSPAIGVSLVVHLDTLRSSNERSPGLLRVLSPRGASYRILAATIRRILSTKSLVARPARRSGQWSLPADSQGPRKAVGAAWALSRRSRDTEETR